MRFFVFAFAVFFPIISANLEETTSYNVRDYYGGALSMHGSLFSYEMTETDHRLEVYMMYENDGAMHFTIRMDPNLVNGETFEVQLRFTASSDTLNIIFQHFGQHKKGVYFKTKTAQELELIYGTIAYEFDVIIESSGHFSINDVAHYKGTPLQLERPLKLEDVDSVKNKATQVTVRGIDVVFDMQIMFSKLAHVVFKPKIPVIAAPKNATQTLSPRIVYWLCGSGVSVVVIFGLSLSIFVACQQELIAKKMKLREEMELRDKTSNRSRKSKKIKKDDAPAAV